MTLIFAVWTRYGMKWVNMHVTTAQYARLLSIGEMCVHATELAYRGDGPVVKKQAAVDYATKVGPRFRLNLTEDEWSAVIEDAVHNMKAMQPQLEMKKG